VRHLDSLCRGARRQVPSGCSTGLFGVHQIVWQRSDSMVDYCRPQWLTDMAGHRTMNSGCPARHLDSLRRGARRHAASGCSTGLSSVHRTVWQQSDPMVNCCRPQQSADVARHRTVNSGCPMCTRLSTAPIDRKLSLSIQRLEVWVRL
jgi:hypothetical protein